MELHEWRPIAERIGRLWKPPMPTDEAEEYFAVLECFAASQVSRAIDLIARQPRSFRPDVGLIYETADAQPNPKALPPGANPDPVDPVDAQEHERVLEENRRRQTAEHRRRVAVVVDILRASGKRIPLTELPALMATRYCSAEDFDRRIARFRGDES